MRLVIAARDAIRDFKGDEAMKQPKLDPKKIAKALGADHRGNVSAKSGQFGAMLLVAAIQPRFVGQRSVGEDPSTIS